MKRSPLEGRERSWRRCGSLAALQGFHRLVCGWARRNLLPLAAVVETLPAGTASCVLGVGGAEPSAFRPRLHRAGGFFTAAKLRASFRLC